MAQETVASKNTTQVLITGNMIGDSNGSPKFITVKVIDSNKNSFEAVSDGIIVDTQKPVLTANIINDHIFGTREIVRIEIASNKTVNAPVVISNNVNATIEGEDTVGTKFIYDLQLSEDFTTGSYTVTITAKDLTEPAETANISTTSVEFYVDTNKTYPFAQGDGSEGNPFLISNAEELNQVRYYPDFYYKQIADIDLEEFINTRLEEEHPSANDTNSVAGWLPIDVFSKTYDGNSYSIKNLFIDRKSDYIGLFSTLKAEAIIKNLTIENSIVKGIKNVGSLIGYGGNYLDNCICKNSEVYGYNGSDSLRIGGIAGSCTKIKNCHYQGEVNGFCYVGGIVGEGVDVSDSTVSATINGAYDTGSIIGYVISGNISNCSSSGNIKAHGNAGGIAGNCFGHTIIQNSNSQTIINGCDSIRIKKVGIFWDVSFNHASYALGGIAGYVYGNNSIFRNCIHTGKILGIKGNDNIYGSNLLGGLIGNSDGDNLLIENCKVYSEIENYHIQNYTATGNYDGVGPIGGLIGGCNSTNACIKNCYSQANMKCSYNSNCGGIIGELCGNATQIAQTFSNASMSEIVCNGNGWGHSSGIVGYSTDNNVNISNCISTSYVGNRSIISTSMTSGIINSHHDNFTVSNCLSTTSLQANQQQGNVIWSNSGGIVAYDGAYDNSCTNSNISLAKFIVCGDPGNQGIDHSGRISNNCQNKNIHNNNYAWEKIDNDSIPNNEIHWSSERGLNTAHGADVSKSDFWGASTQETFWANPNKLGWDFDNVWEFRAGYNLPQLRGMPAMEDPDFIN